MKFSKMLNDDIFLKVSLIASVAIVVCILAYTFLPFNEMSFIYNEF